MEKLSQKIRNIIENELKEKSSVKIQDIYKILIDELPDVEVKKRNKRVRSLIDNMLRSKKIERVAPSTYQKIT